MKAKEIEELLHLTSWDRPGHPSKRNQTQHTILGLAGRFPGKFERVAGDMLRLKRHRD